MKPCWINEALLNHGLIGNVRHIERPRELHKLLVHRRLQCCRFNASARVTAACARNACGFYSSQPLVQNHGESIHRSGGQCPSVHILNHWSSSVSSWNWNARAVTSRRDRGRCRSPRGHAKTNLLVDLQHQQNRRARPRMALLHGGILDQDRVAPVKPTICGRDLVIEMNVVKSSELWPARVMVRTNAPIDHDSISYLKRLVLTVLLHAKDFLVPSTLYFAPYPINRWAAQNSTLHRRAWHHVAPNLVWYRRSFELWPPYLRRVRSKAASEHRSLRTRFSAVVPPGIFEEPRWRVLTLSELIFAPTKLYML